MKRLMDIWGTMHLRWKRTMPNFFRKVMYICVLIGGTAIAAHTSITMFGGTPHEWWQDIYPYIVGGSAGAAFICKFTVNGGFKGEKIDHTVFGYDKETHMED